MTEQQQVAMQSTDLVNNSSNSNRDQIPLQQIQSAHNSQSHSPQSHSPTNSISLIKLDELSSFGATKQSRLPALIKLNEQQQQALAAGHQHQHQQQPNSMPAMSVDQLERTPSGADKQQVSLPVGLAAEAGHSVEGKENSGALQDSSEDFCMVDDLSCNAAEMMGPSLPQPQSTQRSEAQQPQRAHQASSLEQAADSSVTGQTVVGAAANHDTSPRAGQLQQPPSHLGDSLIDMIINLRNENQSLVRALETNNDYVKERLSEFKRINEEAKRREAHFAMERADHEHQVRKLQRQNSVLSERLKSMEAKLKDMKLEVSDSLAAAHSSKASSIRAEQQQGQLYPQLGEPESFANSALNQATTIQMDATSGELHHNPAELSSEGEESSEDEDQDEDASSSSGDSAGSPEPTAPPMDTSSMGPSTTAAKRVGAMSREELGRRFDADKAEFYALDDPMKQCDKLEQQLNDIGKRDYEICLLQQQLNIYRQDYRLERMANLEAKIQIERLKSDIDRLCLDRLNEKSGRLRPEGDQSRHSRHHKHRGSGRFEPAVAAADAVISKLGHHLSKTASRAAAKAAKHAAKQARREEKAAARASKHAAASAARAAAHQQQQQQQSHNQAPPQPYEPHGHHHHRSHPRGHSHLRGLRAVKSEVVTDLMSTANKAMLTGYKMASTHVNLALDKLSQFEQAQASQLAQNRANQADNSHPHKPMGPPSVD